MIVIPERCLRCGGWRAPAQRRPQFAPFWRSPIPIRNTAGKLQRDPTTGKIKRNATTGKLVANSATVTTCCCEEDYDCTLCGVCCFSSLSLIEVSWTPNGSPTFTSGDAAAAWQTKTFTGLIWRGNDPSPGVKYWSNDEYENNEAENIAVRRICASNFWDFRTKQLTSGGGPWPDHYQLFPVTFVPSGGDCCGQEGIVELNIAHFEAGSGADPEPVGEYTGNFDFVITVTNNICCKSGASCNKVENNCNGTCP